MKYLIISVAFILSTFTINAQRTITAADVIVQINTGEAIELTNTTILGDLDFTTIKKKYKGGRYGLRRGIAQEYFTKVQSSVSFTNCTFTGSVITRTEITEGKVKNENYTTFNAPVSFIDCRFQSRITFQDMRIKKLLTLQGCTFEKTLKFADVHFEFPPVVKNNNVRSGFVNSQTNWDREKSQIMASPPPPKGLVTIILSNPTAEVVEIKFSGTKWSLSPQGTSGLERKAGTKIFLLEDGKEKLILTLDESMNEKEFDVSKF